MMCWSMSKGGASGKARHVQHARHLSVSEITRMWSIMERNDLQS
jgi:hypothetical protein